MSAFFYLSALPYLELKLVPALGWALLQFVWQGLLIACGAAFVLTVFLRGARPQTRYAVACAALLACAVVPVASIAYSLGQADDVSAAAAMNLPTYLPPYFLQSLPGLPTFTGATGDASSVGDAHVNWRAMLQRQLPWIVLLWAGGAAFMSLRLGIGLLWVRQISTAGHEVSDPYWQRRLYHLARRFGIERRVRLGVVEGLESPMTAGWWQPVVLVPAALLSGMPAELLEALLAHELAHIKRHDYLVNLLQSAIEVALFYHPAVWWLSSRIRHEREQVADDLAIGVLGEPRRLALALSELDQFQFATPPLAHAASGGNLMSRIKRLLRPTVEPLGWKCAVPLLGLAAACTMLYAAAAPVPALPAPPSLPAAPAIEVSAPDPVSPPAPIAAPAPPASKAPPAAPAAPPIAAPVVGIDDIDAYAVVRGKKSGMMMSGRSGKQDWSQLQKLKQSINGDFVWFHHDGKTYLIQDPAVLAKINEAWLPNEKFSKEMEAYSAKMDEQGKVINALGQKMGAAGQEQGRIAEGQARQNAALAQQQAELAEQSAQTVAELSATATGAQREANERKVAALQARIEALQAQSEKLMGQDEPSRETQRSMEAIGRQMEAAARPMNVLGKQMEALGKQQERVNREAERTTRELLREALKTGKAVPAM